MAHYPANCALCKGRGVLSRRSLAHLGALGLSKMDTKESKGAERITWALQSCKKLQDRRKEELVKVPVDKYNYYYISTCRLVNLPVDKDGPE